MRHRRRLCRRSWKCSSKALSDSPEREDDMRVVPSAWGLAAALPLLVPPAPAQTPAEFYKGRTIELDIGTSAGGGYDVHSRLLAKHMSKYLPGNPTIVPKHG